jgi:hypothetical protein
MTATSNNPYNEVLLYSSGKKRELSGRINMHMGAEQDKETAASQLSHTFSPLKTLYNAFLRLPPPTDASKRMPLIVERERAICQKK